MLPRLTLATRALPSARLIHASPIRSVAESSTGNLRTSTYTTPGDTKDPFKTVSSGYPTSDVGVTIDNTNGVRPEDLHEAASNTSAEGAERPAEMKIDQGLTEPTQTGMIGGYRPTRLG